MSSILSKVGDIKFGTIQYDYVIDTLGLGCYPEFTASAMGSGCIIIGCVDAKSFEYGSCFMNRSRDKSSSTNRRCIKF